MKELIAHQFSLFMRGTTKNEANGYNFMCNMSKLATIMDFLSTKYDYILMCKPGDEINWALQINQGIKIRAQAFLLFVLPGFVLFFSYQCSQ